MNYEQSVNLQDFGNIEDLNLFNKTFKVSKVLSKEVNLDAFVSIPEEPKKVIVLLPSAQSSSGDVKNPIFHRWSWYNSFQDSIVVSFSDPALYTAKLSACWFLSDVNTDYFADMASFLRVLNLRFGIDEEDFLLYGSSMGGLGL